MPPGGCKQQFYRFLSKNAALEAKGLQPQGGRREPCRPKPPTTGGQERMPPKRLLGAILLHFIDQNAVQTEPLRQKASNHRGGGGSLAGPTLQPQGGRMDMTIVYGRGRWLDLGHICIYTLLLVTVVVIFGISAKNAAQRWGREPLGCPGSLFPDGQAS